MIYYLVLFTFLIFNNLAATEDSLVVYEDFNCEETELEDSTFELSYEEKLRQGNKLFQSKISQKNTSCNPSKEKVVSSSSSASGATTSQTNLENMSETNLGYNSEVTNNIANNSIPDSASSSNGVVPKCIQSFQDDDELEKTLKEAIAIENDKFRKQELLKNYANLKGIKLEVEKC